MARRKNFNGIVANLVGSFVSRNNDVSGYWAIGRLNALAAAAKTRVIEVDLLDETSSHVDVADVARTYRQWITTQLERSGMPAQWLAKAAIYVEFGRFEGTNPPPQTTYGEPFTCRATLVDDLGHVYSRTVSAWSAPHDPTRELRSLRVAGSRDA
jgi:hypothetical protein